MYNFAFVVLLVLQLYLRSIFWTKLRISFATTFEILSLRLSLVANEERVRKKERN